MMPFEKMSAEELAANPEYVSFLKALKIGEGAKTSTEREGVGKVTIKQHLKTAAAVAGIEIKFHRSGKDMVVVERVS